MSDQKKLDALAELLEKSGGDPKRLEIVRRAQRFRRSWVELAEVLTELRKSRRYTKWDYGDFHEYCQEELMLKRSTIDKLTMSYYTLSRHAPEILARDGVAQTIPSLESVGYFGRAIGETFDDLPEFGAKKKTAPPRELGGDLAQELRKAVFDEGLAANELHRRFDEDIFPKSAQQRELAQLRRTAAMIRKVLELVSSISDLPQAQQSGLTLQLNRVVEHITKRTSEAKEAASEAS